MTLPRKALVQLLQKGLASIVSSAAQTADGTARSRLRRARRRASLLGDLLADGLAPVPLDGREPVRRRELLLDPAEDAAELLRGGASCRGERRARHTVAG